MVGFLDLYGLINARIVSLGRYGKTREIMSSLPERVVKGLCDGTSCEETSPAFVSKAW